MKARDPGIPGVMGGRWVGQGPFYYGQELRQEQREEGGDGI